ncbi:MAG: hypothetical protein HY452_02550 [Parcubacteria group bacterium]|nr:hypothetical protein [Parcubacteria group bacterium]
MEGKEFGGPSPEDMGVGNSLKKEGGTDMVQQEKDDRMPSKEAQEEANMVKIIAVGNAEFLGDRYPSAEDYKAGLDELEELQREMAEFRENEAKVLTKVARVMGVFPDAVSVLFARLRHGDSPKEAFELATKLAKERYERWKMMVVKGGDAGVELGVVKDFADKIARRDSEDLTRGEF